MSGRSAALESQAEPSTTVAVISWFFQTKDMQPNGSRIWHFYSFNKLSGLNLCDAGDKWIITNQHLVSWSYQVGGEEVGRRGDLWTQWRRTCR